MTNLKVKLKLHLRRGDKRGVSAVCKRRDAGKGEWAGVPVEERETGGPGVCLRRLVRSMLGKRTLQYGIRQEGRH
jgi:hypothetical protein